IRPDRCKACRRRVTTAPCARRRVDLLLQRVIRHASCSVGGVSPHDLPSPMLWAARPDLSCARASPAWLEFTGCSAEEAAGHGWAQCVHAEDLGRWLDT